MTLDLHGLSDAERFDWLCLIRSENIGPRTFLGLMSRFGTARAAIEALPRLSGRAVKVASRREIEAEMEAARRAGIRFIALCEPAYPPALRAIDSAPPVLAVKGNLDVLQRPMVAIVGSRNASASGLVLTERLAQGIGSAGYVIVSRLARGVDIKAHVASLPTGTIAVLAGGHDRIYPSEHANYVARIAERGAVVTEMPFAWEPRGRDFPRRNRVVSGLSLGLVVVEAARRSGSLITARFANEQGREVFAVPGSPLDPRAEGTNDLLRQGATFCTSVADVTDALQPLASAHAVPHGLKEGSRGGNDGEPFWDEMDGEASADAPNWADQAPRSGVQHRSDEEVSPTNEERDARSVILDLIGAAPVSVDDLVRVSGIPVRLIQSVLMELELDGGLQRLGVNLVARVP